GVSPRITTSVARATLPVKSGTDRQPSRASSRWRARTRTGLNRTKGPWQESAFLCPVTSTEKARSDTPIWGAATPTHDGEANIVSSRSAARAFSSGPISATGSATRLSTWSGKRTRGRTGTGYLGRLQHVSVAGRADGHREVEVGLRLGQRRLQRVGGHVVGRLDQHHHGEVPRQHGHGAVLEVAAHAEQHTGHGGHDPRPVGAEGPHCE